MSYCILIIGVWIKRKIILRPCIIDKDVDETSLRFAWGL